MAVAWLRDSAACKSFVIGHSAGHVGTLVLSDLDPHHHQRRPSLYASSTSAAHRFYFETYKPTGAAAEAAQARAYLTRLAPGAGVAHCVDLSHFHLPFVVALTRELSAANRTVHLLRIRRPRWQFARSVTSCRGHLCADPKSESELDARESALRRADCLLMVGFCPSRAHSQAGTGRLRLPLPAAAFGRLTSFEKALWIADETEAHWCEVVLPEASRLPRVHAHETWWSSTAPQSFADAAQAAAGLAGLELVRRDALVRHPHATNASANATNASTHRWQPQADAPTALEVRLMEQYRAMLAEHSLSPRSCGTDARAHAAHRRAVTDW